MGPESLNAQSDVLTDYRPSQVTIKSWVGIGIWYFLLFYHVGSIFGIGIGY